MSMKKIMFAISSLSSDGAERVASVWANHLVNAGNEVYVMLINITGKEYPLDSRVNLIPLAPSRNEYLSMSKINRLWKRRQILREVKPDVVVSFLPRCQIIMLAATFGLKVKRIETIRNNPWTDTDIGNKRALWNLCFRRSNCIIVQTDEQGEYFDSRMRKKCVTVPNPLSPSFLTANAQYRQNIKRFIAVGRISAQKNYPLMIESFVKAAGKKQDIRLDIYGTGTKEDIQKIQSIIDTYSMSDRITLQGRSTDIAGELSRSDVFLMSSDYEGMPNALAEAMSVGLPCISTNCKTGPCDMIKDGWNGCLAKTGDVDDFSEKIRNVLAMSESERRKMGMNAQNSIREMCNNDAVFSQLDKVFAEI